MKRFVIYTAIVGGYDNLVQPQVLDDRFDYILFSNDTTQTQMGIWQVRPIPYQNSVQTKIARYVKTHPEQLLPEYEASLWIDGNVRILSAFVYERFIALFEEKKLLAAIKHPDRNCIYDEMFAVMEYEFESEDVVLRWGHQLRKEGYPRNHGLCETGVLYRWHADPLVKQFDELWWRCIEQYSRRDQLSFNYCLWHLQMENDIDLFLPPMQTVHNSPHFACRVAVHGNANLKCRDIHMPRLVRCACRYPVLESKIQETYYKLYGLRFYRMWCAMMGHWYRLKLWIWRKKKRIL